MLLEQLDIPHLHGVDSSEDKAHEELQKAIEEEDELDSEEEDSQPEFEAWMKELQRQQSGLIVLNDEEAASQLEFGALMREIENEPDETTTEQHCYVSRRQRQPIRPIPPFVLDANTVIVSCGMTNFESTVYTDGKQLKFRTHLGDRKVEVDHFRKPKKEYRDDVKIFSESFKNNYPTLCQGRDIYIIDCTGFDSPEHDLRLRSHTGNHPTILKSIVES